MSLVINKYAGVNGSSLIRIVDSMPIITCSGKRRAKVATEITAKGYCSAKSLYYYGVKLHLLSSRVNGTLPYPQSIIITPASENDLNVFRDNWSDVPHVAVFADKIYIDAKMQSDISSIGSELFTPVNYSRCISQIIKHMGAEADGLYSYAVSQIRQPIESFYNWLIEKTDIQRASKVHSTNGLMAHIFNKIASALLRKFCFNC